MAVNAIFVVFFSLACSVYLVM